MRFFEQSITKAVPQLRRVGEVKAADTALGPGITFSFAGRNSAGHEVEADVYVTFHQGTGIARRLSKGVLRNIRQNLFFAFLYNMLGVPVAAGVLYPFFGILLSPMIAAAAMTFSSVSVIANALRLKRLSL